ncbi:MAG: hypothetical protein HYV15_07800 [Elusimicrobia bacterium]|nr:hypothetical protein [Elusimicrobiota bacterium]
MTSPTIALIQGILYRFDANLVQLSSVSLNTTLGSQPRIAYGGGTVFVASCDSAAPAHAILHKYDSSSLASLGVSTNIYVLGATPETGIAADANSLVLGLTSSTADGGNFLAFRFDHSFNQLSSGVFDAGFAGADSLTGVALYSGDSVVLAGAGKNGAHDDGVVMVRTLASGGGAPAPMSFSGTFPVAGGALAAGANEDRAYDILKTTGDGHVFVVGQTSSPATSYDGLILHYDVGGNLVSSATYGLSSYNDAFRTIVQHANGDLYIGGAVDTTPSANSDMLLLRVSSTTLALISSATINNSTLEYLEAATAHPNGDMYFAGHHFGASFFEIDLLRISTALTVQGATGWASSLNYYANGVVADPLTGNVYTTGRIENGAVTNLLVTKVDQDLNFPVTDEILGAGQADGGIALAGPGPDLYVTGSTAANGGDIILARYAVPALTLTSTATFGGPSFEIARDLGADATGDLLLAGSAGSPSDYLAMRVNPLDLALISSATADGAGNMDSAFAFVVGQTGALFLTGEAYNGVDNDIRTMRMAVPLGGGPAAPPPPVFSGNYVSTGAMVGGVAQVNSYGRFVVVDTVTVGGPYAYVMYGSTTTSAIGESNWVTGGLVKYNSSGVMLASATLEGDHSVSIMATDGLGNIFVREITGEATATKYITKFGPNLQRLATLQRPASWALDMAVAGGALYAFQDGDPGGPAVIEKYDLGLAGVTGSIAGPTSHFKAGSLTVAPSGEVFVLMSSQSQTGAPRVFKKYDAGLTTELASADVTAIVAERIESRAIIVLGADAFVLDTTPNHDTAFIRKFNASTLAYSGQSSTLTLTSPVGMRAGPDGNLYVVGAGISPAADFLVVKYDPSLTLVSSASFSTPFPSTNNRADDLAFLGVGQMLVTGVSSNTFGTTDALTVKMTMSAPPPPAGSSVTLAFAGVFLSGARINNDANGADIGHQLVIDSTGGFVYATIHSTTSGSPGASPDQAAVVKYDPTGVMVASTTLLGSLSGDALVFENGSVFVAEKDAASLRRIVKLGANLERLQTVTFSPNNIGNITRAASRAGFIYTVNDGGSVSQGAKVVKLDTGLNEVARATFPISTQHVNGNNIVITPFGEVFVAVTDGTSTVKLVKYDQNLNALAQADVSALFPAGVGQMELAFSNGVLLAGSYDLTNTVYYLRKFDPNLNYSGASSTLSVQSAPGSALRAGPDGLFYLAITSYSADGGDYALKVFDADLIEKASASFDAGFAGFDQAIGLAVLDSSNVFVTGTGLNGANGFDAVTFVKNLSDAGSGTGGAPAGDGYWGVANKAGRLWSAYAA